MGSNGDIDILAIDEQPVLLEGLTTLLSEIPRYRIAVAIDNPSKNVELIRDALPDVLVLDHLASGGSGLATIRHLAQTMPSTKIVAFSRNCGVESALEAIHCGASGFVLKRGPTSELLLALAAVLRGQSFVCAEYAPEITGSLSPDGAHSPVLNQRDIEILDYLVEGKTNQEIATNIGVAAQTVGHNMTSLMLKLRARNRVEAVILAQRYKKHKML